MARILLVEDDTSVRQALGELLREAGYEVAEAGNGAEALDRAAERRPDLILFDLVMPTMDGWQLREALKGDALLRGVPVIVTSASRAETRTLGDVAASFWKPFDVKALLEAVRRIAPGGKPQPPGPG